MLHINQQSIEERRNNGSWRAEVAIEALEKQIPKKPIITKFDNGAEIINCGKCYMCAHITRAVDYCPHCGQKIDWEKANEN